MPRIDLDQYWPGAQTPGAMSKPASGVGTLSGPQQGDNYSSIHHRKHGQGDNPSQVNAYRPDRRTPMIWGGLGFLAGMCAWHMIGFWSFVANVAFNDERRVAATANVDSKTTASLRKSKPIANGNSRDAIHAGNCIALEIDRTSGDAKSGACPVDEKPLADAGRTRRDDLAFSRPRLQDPQIWSDVTAVASEVAAETIDESSFDLTIRPSP